MWGFLGRSYTSVTNYTTNIKNQNFLYIFYSIEFLFSDILDFCSSTLFAHLRIFAHAYTFWSYFHQFIFLNILNAIVKTIVQCRVKNNCIHQIKICHMLNATNSNIVSFIFIFIAFIWLNWVGFLPDTSLLERTFVAAFFLHTLRDKSPGRWWMPTIWPL